MKRGCPDIEVVEWPSAGGGRSSFSGRQDKCLLTEAEYVELVGDEVGSKTGGTHISTGGSAGNSSDPKRIVSLEPAMPKMVERWAIR